jgi:hypothetical protein
MKIQTSELSDAALDWAVAKCQGYFSTAGQDPEYWASAHGADHFVRMRDADGHGVHWTHGSTDWSEGGPIIEREEIRITPDGRNDWTNRPPISWGAAKYWSDGRSDWWFGPTPLIAAMRCYVAAKLGSEIDIPKERL